MSTLTRTDFQMLARKTLYPNHRRCTGRPSRPEPGATDQERHPRTSPAAPPTRWRRRTVGADTGETRPAAAQRSGRPAADTPQHHVHRHHRRQRRDPGAEHPGACRGRGVGAVPWKGAASRARRMAMKAAIDPVRDPAGRSPLLAGRAHSAAPEHARGKRRGYGYGRRYRVCPPAPHRHPRWCVRADRIGSTGRTDGHQHAADRLRGRRSAGSSAPVWRGPPRHPTLSPRSSGFEGPNSGAPAAGGRMGGLGGSGAEDPPGDRSPERRQREPGHADQPADQEPADRAARRAVADHRHAQQGNRQSQNKAERSDQQGTESAGRRAGVDGQDARPGQTPPAVHPGRQEALQHGQRDGHEPDRRRYPHSRRPHRGPVRTGQQIRQPGRVPHPLQRTSGQDPRRRRGPSSGARKLADLAGAAGPKVGSHQRRRPGTGRDPTTVRCSEEEIRSGNHAGRARGPSQT